MESFIVMCERWGGATGYRMAELKKDGKVQTFETFELAQAEAQRLTKEMNGPHATATFKYWAYAQKPQPQ